MWGLPQRQGSIHQSTFDVSRQLTERGEACLVRRLPHPCARWLAGRGENFTTPFVYFSSLPWLERLSYCLEYMSLEFNMNYQYILQTLMYIDVFQSVHSLILLRMQQHSPSPLDPRPRGGRVAIHSVSYSQNDIYCTTIIDRLPEEAKSQSQG